MPNERTDVDDARRAFLALTGGAAAGTLAAPAIGSSRVAAQANDADNRLGLEQIGRYESDIFDEGGAEIVDYNTPTQRLFVINAQLGGVDVLDVSDPANPTKVDELDVAGTLEGVSTANSVSVADDIVAVAIEATTAQDPGQVGFYDPQTLALQGSVQVGALPDKVTISPDGQSVLVANEGEPNEAYGRDPVGSVSVIDISSGVDAATVETAGFSTYVGQEDELRGRGIRIFGPGANAAEDFEPEYVTISEDSQTAWVSLQENNAIAVIDIDTATVTDLFALGFKDHSIAENALDASNEDGGINIRNWPIYGIRQPDAIGSYNPDGKTYIVTANEGDARDYDGYSEESELSEFDLDPEAFDVDEIDGINSVDELTLPENLGTKNATTTLGDIDDDGLYEELYVFGGRSFSIFTADGDLVFDSGNDIERITAERFPSQFNNDNDESDFDGRSDNKGPEPEGLVIGEFNGHYYAFIGLERIGGVMTYDITNPESPEFLDYINDRDFSVDIEAEIENGSAAAGAAGDLGPEGLSFAGIDHSPTGDPLVFVGHEVSGTTTTFRLTTGAGSQSLIKYADTNGVVGTDGLLLAINDWRNDEIETSHLLDAVNAWRTSNPIY